MSTDVADRRPVAARPAPAARRMSTVSGGRARVAAAGRYTSLLLVGAVFLLPLMVVLLTSLKTDQEVLRGPLSLPHNWLNYHNYVTAFTKGQLLLALANTAFILVCSVTGTVII